MTYSDLKCPVCGEEPRDVSESYFDPLPDDFLPAPTVEAILWTCRNGHRHITGDRGDGVESMEVAQ